MLARLARLLGTDGNCFDVAIDHGVFNEPTFLGGIEDMERAVAAIVEAGPDAIQLTPGQAPLLQRIPGKAKPALVMRADVANVYGTALARHLFCHLVDEAVAEAVRLDAAAVVVNLLLVPDRPELHRQCLENVVRLRPACQHAGMPLMVEPIAMALPDAGSGGYRVDGDAEKIVPLVRQAIELGADLIKADPTDVPDDFRRVVIVAAGKPVLVRGGGKASEVEIFRRTRALLDMGARGIVYGRNVIQHPRPTAITRAFMAMVHEGATPERAMAIVARAD